MAGVRLSMFRCTLLGIVTCHALQAFAIFSLVNATAAVVYNQSSYDKVTACSSACVAKLPEGMQCGRCCLQQ